MDQHDTEGFRPLHEALGIAARLLLLALVVIAIGELSKRAPDATALAPPGLPDGAASAGIIRAAPAG